MNASTASSIVTCDASDSVGTSHCFQICAVSKTYRQANGNDSVVAIKPLTVDIPWDSRVAILGFSGSGKSTLLNLLGLLDEFDQGESGAKIHYHSEKVHDYRDLRSKVRDKIRREDFGFVFQSHCLLGHIPCRENVALALGLAGTTFATRKNVAEQLLSTLGLSKFASRNPKRLSGGEAQRISLLRAMAHNPRVLLADEPTGSLDPKNADLVTAQLKKWQQDGSASRPRTLLMVTHDVGRAYATCSHFLILHDGKAHEGRLFAKAEIASPQDLSALLLPPTPHSPGAGSLPAAPVSPIEENAIDPQNGARHSTLAYGAYLGYLAWSELKSNPVTAIINLLALLFLVALVVVGWGMLEGKRALLERELEDPLARCLMVDGLNTPDNTIDDDLIKTMQEVQLANGQKPLMGPDRIFRWNHFQQQFWRGDSAEPERLVDHRQSGRSLVVGDPMVEKIGSSGKFSGDTAREIIVTTKFLEDAAYRPTAGTVWLDCTGRPLSLTVVGVVPSIPGDYLFIVPDDFWQALQSHAIEPDPAISSLRIAPWPSDPKAMEMIEPLLKESCIRHELDDSGLTLRTPPGRALHEGEFHFLARKVCLRLEEAQLVPLNTLQVHLPTLESAPRALKRLYMNASGYLERFADLDETATQLRQLGLNNLDPRYAKAANRLYGTVFQLQIMLVIIVVFSATVGLFNLFLTSFMQIAQRRAELGILKAMGMNSNDVSIVFGFRGVIIGSAAGLLGIVLGWVFGKQFAAAVGDARLFAFTIPIASVVFLSVLFLSALACWVAARVAAQESPASAMRK